MNKIFFFSLALLSLFSCKNRNTPNLPESQLQELMNKIATSPAFVMPDSSYVPPSGARHTEIRTIDPAAPPEIIDIVGNLNNKKAFKLSDFASEIKYIFFQPPPDLIVDVALPRGGGSQIASDDEHIFIITQEGLFCYSSEGQYLYTVVAIQTEDGSGIYFSTNIDLWGGNLIFRTYDISSGFRLNVFDIKDLDAQMRFITQPDELKNFNPQPTYQRRIDNRNIRFVPFLLMDDQNLFIGNTLIGVTVYGDTLCKFSDHGAPTVRGRQGFLSNTYRINGQVMFLKGHNDTVFRVIPPNRLAPAYVLQWGKYKPDVNKYAYGGDYDGKLIFGGWVETPHFIFINYTEGSGSLDLRREGKAKDCWAIYNKTAKTLTHHLTDKSALVENFTIHPMFENDIDAVGMPFYPTGVNHRDEMYMTFTKERVKNLIASGLFQNDKLQAIYDDMPEGGFCLMIVK